MGFFSYGYKIMVDLKGMTGADRYNSGATLCGKKYLLRLLMPGQKRL